ncbi:MAG: Ger(x)C family spore germination protein [Bacillota bacterium]
MRLIRLTAALLLAASLTGCWGSRETDDLAFVLVAGFDKGPGKNVIMTFQIANPVAVAGTATGGGGGRGGGNAKPLINISTVQRLPIGAFNLASAEVTREISLLHTAAFVFSEELARDGLSDYLYPLNRHSETRGTALVIVCRGKARDFLEKSQPRLETSPAKQYQHLLMLNRNHGLSVTTTYTKFYSQTKSASIQPTAPLAAIGKKDVTAGNPEINKLGDYLPGNLPSIKGQTQFLGAAVFKGDRMVAELTGDETRYLNMLNGNLFQSFLVIEDPKRKGEAVGLALRQARKPKVKVNFADGSPVIDVEIFQEPSIVGISSGINYESLELKPVLESALEEIIREQCLRLVARSQEEFRADIFGFGREARKYFLTQDTWEKYNWPRVYPQARVNVNVNVKIRRTGLMVETRPIRY